MPDEIGLKILSFMLHENSFLDPSDHFPSFELDSNVASIYRFTKPQIDMTGNGVTCEVKGLVELDKG